MKKPTDKEMLDFIQRQGKDLENGPSIVCLNDAGWAVDNYSKRGKTLRQAIRNAMKQEGERK